jgi:hypothetical protein
LPVATPAILGSALKLLAEWEFASEIAARDA